MVENDSARTQGQHSANAEDCSRGQGESIAMLTLEEKQNADAEGDNQAERLKINRDTNGKCYGTLQE